MVGSIAYIIDTPPFLFWCAPFSLSYVIWADMFEMIFSFLVYIIAPSLVVFNKNNVKAVIDGHTHIQSVSNLGNFNEYTMAGYLEKRAYTLLRINERNATVKCAYYLYD